MKQRGLAQKLHGPKSAQVSDVDTDLCKAHYESGAYVEAERMCGEAFAIETGLGHVRAKTKLVTAELAFQQGRFDRTVQLATEAMPELQQAKDLALYGRALWVRAIALSERNEMEQAGNDYREWIALYEKLYGTEHPQMAWAYAGYGEYLTNMGNIAEGRRLLIRAMGIMDRTLAPDHPDATSPRFRLAKTYLEERKWPKAIELLRPVVEIRTRKLGGSHVWTMLAAHNLAWALAESGQKTEARDWLTRLQPLVERDFAGPNAHRAKFYRTEIQTLLALGDTTKASALMKQLRSLDIGVAQTANEKVEDPACLEAELQINLLKQLHEDTDVEQLRQRCTKPHQSVSVRAVPSMIAKNAR
jgi:tetratricopeptide (TPR) repeat protein